MFYYYDRDKDGIEHCFEVPDKKLVDDVEARLLLITKDIGIDYPVELVEENYVFGYESADAYLETHDDEDFADWIIALDKGIKEFGYPFAVVRNADASVSVYRELDVPLRELVQSYAQYSGYQVLPDWYMKGNIDIDTANRYGMSGLLRYLERDYRENIRRLFRGNMDF